MARNGRRALAIVSAMVLFNACASGGSSGSSAARRMGPLQGAELRYGAGLGRKAQVTFQPDVVFLGGGARSVRSVSSDGLVWTIDAHAANADRVQPGKILAVTSLGAGRVLAVDAQGDTDRVAMGPAAITDLIRDGTLATATPLALQGYRVYTTPGQPGLASDTSASAGGSGPGRSLRARVSPDPAAPPGTLPPPAGAIPDSEVADWHISSICCSSIGIHVSRDKGGARVQGTAQLKFARPSVQFALHIGGGHVLSASARLNGAASLSFGIAASVEASSADFHGGRIQLPVNIDIPVVVAGIPVNVGLQQLFSVSLGLSGAAELATSGEYALAGSLGFSVTDGRPSVDVPTLRTVKSALDHVQSVAVAPSALEFSYAVKLSIGVGPPGFNAGIWYQVAATLALATSGSQIDPLQGTSLVTCKTVSLSVLGRYGVGYSIPKIVATLVNLFLRAVMRHPPAPIVPDGGPSWGPAKLFEKSTPPCSK